MAGAARAVPGVVETGRANAMKNGSSHLFFRAMAVALVATTLLSCASGPSPGSVPSTSTGTEMATDVFIEVQPSLREAVRKATGQYPSLAGSAIGNRPATHVEYIIRLSFFSQVDRSRQLSNRDGAVAGGLPSMLLGAVMPWPCPTTHQLHALVLRRDGTELAQVVLQEEESRVGTMTWCPTVDEPSEVFATKLANSLFRKLATDGVLGAMGYR
jgi:hypothetical protein